MEPGKHQQSVVQGEASESDEESEPETTTQQPESQPASTQKVTVIKGEASESEEEDEDEEGNAEEAPIPPLTVNTAAAGDRSDITNGAPLTPPPSTAPAETHKPKYNSLLHRKLRDRNIALRRHLVDTMSQAYGMAARDLHSNTLQLLKTQISIQEISRHMRLSTNDLFSLEDKVDIVRQCTILPDIKIDLPNNQPTQT